MRAATGWPGGSGQAAGCPEATSNHNADTGSTHIQEERAAVRAGGQEAADLQLVAGADDAGKAWQGSDRGWEERQRLGTDHRTLRGCAG